MLWQRSGHIMASDYQWRVIIELKQSFSPVSIDMYRSKSYDDACDYLATRLHLVNKKRHLFIKRVGSRERIYLN